MTLAMSISFGELLRVNSVAFPAIDPDLIAVIGLDCSGGSRLTRRDPLISFLIGLFGFIQNNFFYEKRECLRQEKKKERVVGVEVAAIRECKKKCVRIELSS